MNDERTFSVIVAHPEKQHSFQLAAGLKKAGMLFKYITSIYDRPQSITNKIKGFLPEKYKKKAGTRSTSELDDSDIVQIGEMNNLLITILYNIFHMKKLSVTLRLINADYFGAKVAKYAIKNNVDAVVCYDTRALKTFELLRRNAPHIIRILDTTIISSPFMRYLYDIQIRERNVVGLKDESPKLWDDKFLNQTKDEISLSDYFLVASEIVEKSLVFCGVKPEHIIRVPYGVDTEKYQPAFDKSIEGPLKLIIVGGGYRKGLDILFDVVSQYDENDVRLEVIGNYVSIKNLIERYSDVKNITYGGFLTPNELIQEYQKADVFILPSIGEGMALVGLEAMACGLPLICSENTGVNDLITNYEDGIIIPVGRPIAIRNAIDYCIEHRNELSSMGKKARKVAEAHTWLDYQKGVSQKIQAILEQRNTAGVNINEGKTNEKQIV